MKRIITTVVLLFTLTMYSQHQFFIAEDSELIVGKKVIIKDRLELDSYKGFYKDKNLMKILFRKSLGSNPKKLNGIEFKVIRTFKSKVKYYTKNDIVLELYNKKTGKIYYTYDSKSPNDFLLLKNAGPKSKSCMPEAGYLPIPKKLAAKGVKDMVRISDARMSGTAFGTVVLHVSPDAASGGNLAFVQNGDEIRLSVKDKKLDLLISEQELNLRKQGWKMPETPDRGYARLYYETVTQAPLGCDFDFLRSK